MMAIHIVDRLVQRQPCVDRPMGSMTHDNLEIATALFAYRRPTYLHLSHHFSSPTSLTLSVSPHNGHQQVIFLEPWADHNELPDWHHQPLKALLLQRARGIPH